VGSQIIPIRTTTMKNSKGKPMPPMGKGGKKGGKKGKAC
jgi:hypothetical protein